MAVKVLVTAIGQHIIADAKQVENKESGELIGYWLDNPRLVSYQTTPEDEGEKGIAIQYLPYCLLSDEQSFTVRADHIVAILEARDDVRSRYVEIVTPDEEPQSVTVEGEEPDESGDNNSEDG